MKFVRKGVLLSARHAGRGRGYLEVHIWLDVLPHYETFLRMKVTHPQRDELAASPKGRTLRVEYAPSPQSKAYYITRVEFDV